MQPKQKTKKCKVCKLEFRPFNSMAKACSPKCALQIATEARRKREKKEATQWVKDNKPLPKLKAEAQTAINAYVRIRDYHLGCISCSDSKEEVEQKQGWKHGGVWDAGHFKSRGACPQLRFNLKNINKQCKSCNGGSKYSHKEKTVSQKYEDNLILKIGKDEVEKLNNDQSFSDYSREYLERIKRIFNKKTKLYKARKGAD